MNTFEEVIFENGTIIKRLGIFHNTNNGDIEELENSVNNYYNGTNFKLFDYGEGYIVLEDTETNLNIQLECIN